MYFGPWSLILIMGTLSVLVLNLMNSFLNFSKKHRLIEITLIANLVIVGLAFGSAFINFDLLTAILFFVYFYALFVVVNAVYCQIMRKLIEEV